MSILAKIIVKLEIMTIERYFANRYLPVVCHNMRGYHPHLTIEQIYSLYPNKDNTKTL